MSNQPSPAELRRQARMIRDLAQFAQGATRQEELAEALKLERRAHELEKKLSEAG
jgi:hypothetical protein